jgi:hypothetical protein
MTILTFTGPDALHLCVLTNHLAEVHTGTGWRAANSHAEARRFLADDAQLVRLRISDRVLLEDILKTAIPVGTPLGDVINQVDPGDLSKDQLLALTTLQEALL